MSVTRAVAGMPSAYPMSALENHRTGGGGQWAAEQDRPVSCCMAVVTMRLGGGRRSMPDGLSRYLIIVLEISGPWLKGHLIMIKERVFIGRFRRPSLSHVTCSSDRDLDCRPRPLEGSPGGVISSGRASQHPVSLAPPSEWLPAQAHRQAPHFLSPTGEAPASAIPIKLSQVAAPIALRLSLDGFSPVSAGASDEVGRARPHVS
jgi:hypothetical protein